MKDVFGDKIPLVAVVGPTASGKTGLAIKLCAEFNGEVISGDSMQLYRGMAIATAQPTAAERAETPHHLIDMLEPSESFSVARYAELAHRTVREVRGRGRLPVVTGGTGLYIRSLIDNITFAPQKQDTQYRESLCELAREQGNDAVYLMLESIDPVAAHATHPNNLGRVIRALEAYHTTGVTMTRQRELSREEPSPYRACLLGLGYRDRDKLNARINLRVDIMVKQGLLEEAESLRQMELSPTAAQAIGYKELLPYFEGRVTLEQALEDIKLHSRQYAKRQMTWFKSETDIHWLWADDYSSEKEREVAALAVVKSVLNEYI